MNLLNGFKDINHYYSPKIVGEVNDVFIKIVKIKGEEIPWHNHIAEDEMFYILEGKLLFEEEGIEPFIMETGDIYIVKRGINHRVSSIDECKIMLIENKTTAHTGAIVSSITKTLEQQK